MKKGILISILLVFQLGVIYAQQTESSKLDSLINLALLLSEEALFDAHFTEAKKIVQLPYFNNFQGFKDKHEVQLTIQDLRIERFMNIVLQLKPTPDKNFERLSSLASFVNDIEKKELQASYFLSFSSAHRSVGNVDSALVYEAKALSIFKNAMRQDKVAEIQASQISRRHNQFLKEGKKAEILKMIPEYEQAINFSNAHSKYALSYNTRHLAQIHRRQTLNYDEALRLFKTSLQLREEIGFKPFIPASYSSLGDVYFKKGEYLRAIEMYLKATELAKEIGFVRYQTYPYLCIGDIYLKQADKEKASEYYLKALKSASINGYSTGIDNAIEKLGKL